MGTAIVRALNRTIVELKQLKLAYLDLSVKSLNRTIVELKQKFQRNDSR